MLTSQRMSFNGVPCEVVGAAVLVGDEQLFTCCQLMMSYNVYMAMCFVVNVVSFDDDAESKCGDYCSKAIEYCNSNPEAYQLMGSYLLSKQDVEVSDDWLLFLCDSLSFRRQRLHYYKACHYGYQLVMMMMSVVLLLTYNR